MSLSNVSVENGKRVANGNEDFTDDDAFEFDVCWALATGAVWAGEPEMKVFIPFLKCQHNTTFIESNILNMVKPLL